MEKVSERNRIHCIFSDACCKVEQTLAISGKSHFDKHIGIHFIAINLYSLFFCPMTKESVILLVLLPIFPLHFHLIDPLCVLFSVSACALFIVFFFFFTYRY